ncbi:P-loop containing nucleoside triphosphate hydrolase protein [Macrophomina phaseolina]|uniref:Elongation factor 1-alpha n=1 Tax=Macrophomina phaseolina TaxID=35725 RepID=A0ABQ8FXC5_9PEZI|nr:P-loop containing nucleoside triphosphate hydrolase protein [Macrophomina phaseolina]
MADLNSWEDDKDAQDESLAQQAQQQMNLNAGRANTFQPGAATFTPGAATFTPGQPFQQYGGGYSQYGQYYGGGFPQYGQQQQQYGQYGYAQQGYGYGQQQGYGGYPQQNFQQQQQQQQQPRQTPKIAKRGDDLQAAPPAKPAAAPAPAAGSPKAAPKTLSIGGDGSTKVESAGGTKVLSIGGDSPKVEKAGATKVLSIGGSAPASAAKDAANKDQGAPEAGKKVTAAKAIEKTGESAGPAASGKTSPTPSSGRNSPTRASDVKAAKQQADLVAQEQAADVDEETLAEMYGKEHVNVIFLGHVDAGKSTLGGSILYATGMVDERTMDKYKREAKEAGRETWYLSWALDLTKEERSKGKTVEVGRGFFETEKRRYSILDAPGHKTYVPNMIGGASQADVGVLVISARKGEYETGFEKGGQTREHAVLAKTQGVNKLIIVVNKMDDPTVEWSEERYKECTTKLTQFLKGVGYNPKTDLTFMPVSAQTMVGIKDRVPKDICPWYDGPALLEFLDNMKTLERKLNAPFMMPISAKYRDMGTMVEGKIEAGVIKKGVNYLMMPNRETVGIAALYGETEDEIPAATCGEQVRIRLRGIEEEDILPGFVLCSPKRPVHCVQKFEAQIVLLELKSILSAGFNCVLHVHSATEEVTFDALLHKLEKGTGRKSKKPPGFATKGMSIIARLSVTGGAGSVCVERFEDYPQMGRFTLRDQGQTIAIGKITKLLTE